MTLFSSSGFRPVLADDPESACRVFAKRLARRIYGSSGVVRIVRLESWDTSWTFTQWDCFIGFLNRDASVSGSNYHFNIEARR